MIRIAMIFALTLAIAAKSHAERAIPYLSGPVMDEAGFMSAAEANTLERSLRSYLSVAQIQVWTIPSLQGEPIESLAIRAVDQWKLGDKKKDNGVLILVAKQERRARIEVGQGLEGNIPDALAGRIIQQILVPQFRRGNFYLGISSAATAIYKYSGGDPNFKISNDDSGSPKIFYTQLIFLVVLLFGVSLLRGLRGRSGWRSSGFSSSWGGNSGWGSGGGGGGGWSGGGGGFSGGGSSGSW